MAGSILAALALAAGAATGAGAPHCGTPPPCAAPPLPGWIAASEGLPDHRVLSEVRLEGRTIFWAGRPVSRRRLRLYLARGRRVEPAPFILFDASGAANCAEAAALRALVDRAARCGEGGFCGEGRRADWRR